METMRFSNDEMVRLDSMLNQILLGFRGNVEATRYLNMLKKFISDYRSNGSYLHSEIKHEIARIFIILKSLPQEVSKAVADHVKHNCKGCIFHSDYCMMNIIYVIFKSLELNKVVEFNEIRPSMRIMF